MPVGIPLIFANLPSQSADGSLKKVTGIYYESKKMPSWYVWMILDENNFCGNYSLEDMWTNSSQSADGRLYKITGIWNWVN